MKINQSNTVQLMLNHNQSIERYFRKKCIWPLRQQYIKAIEIRRGWYNDVWLPLEKLDNFVFCSCYKILLFFEIYKRGLTQNIQREWHPPSTLPLRSTLRLSVLQTYPPPQSTGPLLSTTRGCAEKFCRFEPYELQII